MPIRSMAFLVLAAVASLSQAQELKPNLLLHSDPEFVIPKPLSRFDERNVGLWRQALQQGDGDPPRLAAEALATAHEMGLAGMRDAAPDLRNRLPAADLQPEARLAIARALIVLDDRESAEALFQASQAGDGRMRLLVEPALANWNYAPIREIWRARLTAPDAGRRELLLAAEGLATVKEPTAVDPLVACALDAIRPRDVRSAAALAAGKIADSGLETDSKQLLADPNAALLDRLCAVLFLQRHTSAEAIEILRGLASDPEPAIAASALETLFTIDPSHVLPLAEKSMASHDANVRWQGQRAYLTLPDPDRIRVLGTQLNDPHPRNRRTIASEFVRLAAQPELDAAIREAAMAALDRDGWREEEQAALILGTLDHKPAADPLVRRLESERGEVMVATAWALKKLAVQDTLPAMLDKAVRQREAPKGGAVSDQLGQLFEGMAVMNFDAAMPEMRRYIPEAAGESVARSGAIWALGKLREDAPDEALAAQLMERAKDFPGGPGNPPEDPLVRLMCVVSVGRMKVKPPLTDLLLLVGPERDADIHEHGYAWAIQQISGETVPDAKRLVIDQRGWFLEPAE